MPDASLIIPTMNRPGLLTRLMGLIDGLAFSEAIEVIIIDQSLEPHEDIRSFRHPARYIHIDTASLPHAKNLGLSLALSDVCIFIDDDVEFDGTFIAGHLACYRDPSVGAVAGRILENSTRTKVTGKTPRTMFGINAFGRSYPNVGGDTDADVAGFRGANFSLRRDLVKTVGVFDTRYRPPFHYEESDYAYRVRRAGYRIRFSAAATVFHKEHPSGAGRPYNPMCYQYSRFHNASLFFSKNMPAPATLAMASAFTVIALRKTLPNLGHFRYLMGALRRGFRTAREESPVPAGHYFPAPPSGGPEARS
jgi:GT2 family glycosyltransferase